MLEKADSSSARIVESFLGLQEALKMSGEKEEGALFR